MREVSRSHQPDWFNTVVLVLVVLAVLFVILRVFDTVALALG
jgi:preprotein translocase subunit SecE